MSSTKPHNPTQNFVVPQLNSGTFPRRLYIHSGMSNFSV
jgi:hypothetical protein